MSERKSKNKPRNSQRGRKPAARAVNRKSRRSAKSKKSTKSRQHNGRLQKMPLERTRPRFTHASESMGMTDLQFMAKSRGIPFGGLSRDMLIKKINTY